MLLPRPPSSSLRPQYECDEKEHIKKSNEGLLSFC